MDGLSSLSVHLLPTRDRQKAFSTLPDTTDLNRGTDCASGSFLCGFRLPSNLKSARDLACNVVGTGKFDRATPEQADIFRHTGNHTDTYVIAGAAHVISNARVRGNKSVLALKLMLHIGVRIGRDRLGKLLLESMRLRRRIAIGGSAK